MAPTPTIAEETSTVPAEVRESGGGPGAAPPGTEGPGGGGGGGRGGLPPGAVPQRAYITGLTMGLAAILMFFMALTSAFIVRKGLSNDWRAFPLPAVLWLNTAILLASSFTIQAARSRLGRKDVPGFRHWWGVTTALGLLFLAGQLVAWRQLVSEGVYLATNPSSSFFYVLTAAHGLHLLGGILALAAIAVWNWGKARITRATATEMAAIYWHFLDGLWVFLFLLLKLGQ
ncbi:MAG TPA: cytochrome c oxidase subunit 3 [Candidatus Acidoferrales bacterium]|nr:cytochrome c oxidase subunit 3 [Candidatus Acidoferrales bacterium]